jgi:hypothetical protein
MNLRKGTSVLKTIFINIFLASLVLLAFTVIRSGYLFEFDIDELYHANTTYLIAKGYEPFRDFFLPYSPLFHTLILPIFTIFGFTIEAIQWTRVLMIALFLVRIAGAMILVRMLFGKLASVLFLPLLLLDPLTQYASMQIRPDALMMTAYTIGLVFLAKGLMYNKKFFVLISGALLSLALLVSIKILPSLGALFLIILVTSWKRRFLEFVDLLAGFAVPILIFALYYVMKDLFVPMVTNLLFDARAINETLKYPAPIGNFYWPSPRTYFGLSFKPALFQYIWSLPLLAFAGAHATLLHLDYSFAKPSGRRTMQLILAISLVLQWVSLFFVRSVFIQYYLPVTWLFAVFGAVALAKFIHAIEINKVLYVLSLVGMGCVYAYYLIPSLQANVEKMKISGVEQKTTIRKQWQHVPETDAVYPGILFRPLAYPIPYGFTFYDLPPSLFTRYEPIQDYLEKGRVPYLNIDDKPWARPNDVVKQYISSHYVQDEEYTLFWKRVK